MIPLWPHQTAGIAQVRKEFRQGNRWVLLVAPTGSGKTVTGTAIALAHLEKRPTGRVLWTAHREELVGQAFDELSAAGLECGVIQSSPCRAVNPHRPVQVASIQTMVARELKIDGVSLVIADEAHHMPSDKWSAPVLQYKRAGIHGVGLTATPVRADGLPMGDIFDALVNPISTAQLIGQGLLVPFELIRPKHPLKRGQIAQSPVTAWLAHAAGRKTIVFAPNIPAAEKFCEEFNSANVKSGIVTGSMDGGKRRDVLDRYKRNEIQVLVNVGVLTEGFDDRPTSCVIIARSVGSVSLYLQICGRGLRTSPETGKSSAILIDLHGASFRHGPPDEDRVYDLDGVGIRRQSQARGPERFCVVCGVSMEQNATVCTECGTEPAGQKPPDVVNAALVKYARARSQGTDKRAANLGKWLKEAGDSGFKPGWAFRKYEAVYGERAPPEIVRLSQCDPSY